MKEERNIHEKGFLNSPFLISSAHNHYDTKPRDMNTTTLPVFRVIIAGTRTFNDYKTLCEYCDHLLEQKKHTHQIIVVSGACRGADRLGERYAQMHGYRLNRFPADWDRHGNKAGFLRNLEMADNANALIAFWDGTSNGTKSMIEIARKKGLAVRIINI